MPETKTTPRHRFPPQPNPKSSLQLLVATADGEWEAVPLARGPRYLSVLSAAPQRGRGAPRLAVAKRRPRGDRTYLVAEPIELERVESGARARLIVLAPPAAGARVNAAPAPRIASLGPGDHLQFAGNGSTPFGLYVTEYAHPSIEAPQGALVGRPCPVCRVPLSADTRVWICPRCGTAEHLEGADRPESERLECALLGPCVACGEPVRTEGGYRFWPEGGRA